MKNKRALFLSLLTLFVCDQVQSSPLSPVNLSFSEQLRTALDSIETLKRLNGMTTDDRVSRFIESYIDSNIEELNGAEKARYALDVLEMQKWGNQVTEFVSLMELVFSFSDPELQARHQEDFDRSVVTLEALRLSINREVHAYHPGFAPYLASELMSDYNGEGVKIAVFDVFDPAILDRQRAHYSEAHIEPVQSFGEDIWMNHGNSVIDIILSIAPHVSIVPVTADTENYNIAMSYVLERDDIHIVNISRAFAIGEDGLDQDFSQILMDLISTKILTKSLGNTGTDMTGALNKRRRDEGLGEVGNLFAYDVALINEFLHDLDQTHQESAILFAINLTPFADKISLTATTPGPNQLVQNRSLGTVSDGIYTWSTGNFESGSSFGAPQIAAFSALLLQSILGVPGSNAIEVVEALKESAHLGGRQKSEFGLGLISGSALQLLRRQSL